MGVKPRMEKIYRHGQLIYVMSGHPMFAQAKREEVLRLEDELDKKQAKGKTQEETEKDASRVTKKLEEEIESKKEWQTGHRLKSGAKIPSTEVNDEDSQPMPINQTIIPEAELKVDPGMNFHGEPIQPKDEPIDWKKMSMLAFNLPILAKKRQVRRKPKPTLAPPKFISKS